ncbi:hypothetical protein ISCGN_009185 [Ixodes scapularis]
MVLMVLGELHHPSDVTLRPYPSPGPTVINVPFLRSYGGPRKKKNKAESHKRDSPTNKKNTPAKTKAESTRVTTATTTSLARYDLDEGEGSVSHGAPKGWRHRRI